MIPETNQLDCRVLREFKNRKTDKLMNRKTKIQIEYLINCSPKVLFNRLSTPSGLAEWFAEDVSVSGKEFVFHWDGSEQSAEITLYKENKLIRFNWKEENEVYFEFRITQHELTGEVSLIVVDFTNEEEKNETIDLWNTQIADLKHVVGS